LVAHGRPPSTKAATHSHLVSDNNNSITSH
jgi:hypothetical protein